MYETLKSLFELLFQGTIAGLIVVLVTRYLENRKAKELAQKHAMLVALEIKEHLISLERIEAAGEISVFSAPCASPTRHGLHQANTSPYCLWKTSSVLPPTTTAS